jgi:tetratricopeptide (TPR) repeat protein
MTGFNSTLMVRVAAVALFVTLALLGVRSLVSLDLGYNLEYGRTFLHTGRIVDSVDFLYTLPPAGTATDQRPAPGPSAWYDHEGRYRFVNANWLSQVVMAGVYRVAGVPGLATLGWILSCTIYGLIFLILRRLGLPLLMATVGLGLYALLAALRFNLRPELFGFVCLAAQFAILSGAAVDPRRVTELSWARIGVLFGIQTLFVNLHSYFMLGIAAAGAICVGCAASWYRARSRDTPERSTARRATMRMGAIVAGLIGVSLVNPWTWRLTILPVETLSFLRTHEIAGGHGEHPWSHIVELHSPFHATFPDSLSDFATIALMAFALLGALAALFRGRAGLLLLIVGMTTVAISMDRNLAPAGIVLLPVSLAAVWDAAQPALARRTSRRFRIGATAACAAAVIVLCSIWSYRIVTNRYYEEANSYVRFGYGISRTSLAIGAARWLGTHLGDVHVWCDTDSSSTLRFFMEPQPELPILTNQWAYPPAVMTENQLLRAGRLPFDRAIERYGVEAVALRTSTSAKLFSSLAADGRWSLVHAEGEYAVLLRNDGRFSDSAIRYSLANFNGDVDDYVADQRAVDPSVERALFPVGRTLLQSRAFDLAIGILEASAAEVKDSAGLWSALGSAYASRGDQRRRASDPRFIEDFLEARTRFQSALRLDPDYAFVQRTLERVERIIAESRML